MEQDRKEGMKTQKDELHEYLIETERSQSNILWEDAHKNAASVDRLLWKGRSDAPMVQRIGIAIFAFLFLPAGLGLALIGTEQGSSFAYVIALLSILIAGRLFWNSLRGIWRRKN
jgi:hypothetical protein